MMKGEPFTSRHNNCPPPNKSYTSLSPKSTRPKPHLANHWPPLTNHSLASTMASPNVNMDAVEALHVALQQSFSPDASIRDPAEASIKHLKFVPGATQMLLHITEEKQVSWSGYSSVALFLRISCVDILSHFPHMYIHLTPTGPI
jgi:hypothetical protein